MYFSVSIFKSLSIGSLDKDGDGPGRSTSTNSIPEAHSKSTSPNLNANLPQRKGSQTKFPSLFPISFNATLNAHQANPHHHPSPHRLSPQTRTFTPFSAPQKAAHHYPEDLSSWALAAYLAQIDVLLRLGGGVPLDGRGGDGGVARGELCVVGRAGLWFGG